MASLVAPHRGGECQDALGYTYGDTSMCCAVLLQVEVPFRSVVDRLD
ncbi:hypothetical protein GXW84_35475 [Rhodococcus sp. IEGM 248]|nr:hypothetical protein [Rhodococcus sp. IEGM 248]